MFGMVTPVTPESDPECEANAEPMMEDEVMEDKVMEDKVMEARKGNSAPPPSGKKMKKSTLPRSLSNRRGSVGKHQGNGGMGMMTITRDTSGTMTVMVRPGYNGIHEGGGRCNGNGGFNGNGGDSMEMVDSMEMGEEVTEDSQRTEMEELIEDVEELIEDMEDIVDRKEAEGIIRAEEEGDLVPNQTGWKTQRGWEANL